MFKKDALTQAALDEQIRLFSEIEGLAPESKEAGELIERIVKIETVKTKKTVLSKDAIFGGVVSLLGMVVVINAEHVGAITTKAFGLVKKI